MQWIRWGVETRPGTSLWPPHDKPVPSWCHRSTVIEVHGLLRHYTFRCWADVLFNNSMHRRFQKENASSNAKSAFPSVADTCLQENHWNCCRFVWWISKGEAEPAVEGAEIVERCSLPRSYILEEAETRSRPGLPLLCWNAFYFWRSPRQKGIFKSL